MQLLFNIKGVFIIKLMFCVRVLALGSSYPFGIMREGST